jgi:hypothetical protein
MTAGIVPGIRVQCAELQLLMTGLYEGANEARNHYGGIVAASWPGTRSLSAPSSAGRAPPLAATSA